MTWGDAWQIAATVLGALGGAGIVAAAVAAFVAKTYGERSLERQRATLTQETERLKAELGKDAETHKWKLKKNELLFEKEYAAAAAFFELRRKYEPLRRHPDMDWHEVREGVMESFGDAERRIATYIAEHGPVLSDENRQLLDECKSLASSHQFAPHGGDDYRDAEQAADKFLDLMRKIEDGFVQQVRS